MSALYGGYVAANMLKWHWWRFNASGFFWGMLAGIVPAMVLPLVFRETLELYYFPLLFGLSLAGCVAGSLLTPPTDEKTLKSFYKTIRPWGFWGPVHALVVAEDPSFQANKNFRLDMVNVVIGIIAQCCLTMLPMYLIIRMNTELLVTGAILAVCLVILKRTWWDKLPTDQPEPVDRKVLMH